MINEYNDILMKVIECNNNDNDYRPNNYSFLEICFPLIECVELDLLSEVNEENLIYDIEVTGYYYNEDESLISIYFSLYNEQLNNIEVVSDDTLSEMYNKMNNLIKTSMNKEYMNLNENSALFDLCETLYRNKVNEVMLVLVTNYSVPNSINTDINYEISGLQVGRRVYDVTHILDRMNSINEDELTLNLESKFGSSVNSLLISSNNDLDVYLTSFPGNWLARLYKEDSTRLLSANVRSYLKKTNKVNKEIINTVKDAPEEFVAYNNGISAICTNVKLNVISENVYQLKELENFQIVNGGQTTASLYECMNDRFNVSNVLVPVKLTVIKNENSLEELTSNISTYSNLQSTIKKSDPPSNNQFFKKMEELSVNIWAKKENLKYHCFFERTAGQYNTYARMYYRKTDTFKINNPEKKKFNKIQMAQAIMSWEQLPNIVSSGQEKNFSHFFNVVKDLSDYVNEDYFESVYALIVLYREIDSIIRSLKLSYKSNVVTYSIALISLYTNKRFDLKSIWETQSIHKDTKVLLTDLVKVVHARLIDSPENYSDIRMWARKKECWQSVTSLEINYNFKLVDENIIFFPVRDEKVFIENDINLKNTSLWKLLNIWDDTNNILSTRQKKFIKSIPTIIYKNTLTKKQGDYAKDLFLRCVESGFNYEDIE